MAGSPLCRAGIPECRALTTEELNLLTGIVDDFTPQEAEKVKEIERTTNHDVKAVEYYLCLLYTSPSPRD